MNSLIKNRYTVINGCWIWKGKPNSSGYGSVSYLGKSIGAHVLSYILHFGEVPKGLDVCHTCDTPLCINPEHLWVGSRQENMIDSARKGRNAMQRRTACPQGHPYDMITDRGRSCSVCMRESYRKYNEKRRPADQWRIADGCKNGHPWLTETTYVTPEGFKQCKICRRARSVKYRATKK